MQLSPTQQKNLDEWLRLGLPKTRIAKHLGVTIEQLKYYLSKRDK